MAVSASGTLPSTLAPRRETLTGNQTKQLQSQYVPHKLQNRVCRFLHLEPVTACVAAMLAKRLLLIFGVPVGMEITVQGIDRIHLCWGEVETKYVDAFVDVGCTGGLGDDQNVLL